MRNALNILDKSFEANEDFMGNSNRLAARSMYVKNLNKAIAENNTQALIMLTNKEHVQSIGQSFSAGNVFNQPITDAQNNQQSGNFLQKISNIFKNPFGTSSVTHASDTLTGIVGDDTTRPTLAPRPSESNSQHLLQETPNPISKEQHPRTQADERQVEEEIILMERPMDGYEWLHNNDAEDNYGYVRHEQFFSLKDDYNFERFKDGGIREDDPNLRSQYIQRDKRVSKKKFIMQAKMELEKEAEEEKNKALLVDTDNPEEDYYLIGKNCLHYVNDIISRAEKIAEEAGESLFIK